MVFIEMRVRTMSIKITLGYTLKSDCRVTCYFVLFVSTNFVHMDWLSKNRNMIDLIVMLLVDYFHLILE